VGGHARTYCRPCSRLSASPAGHATLLPWLAPQQHTRLRALGLATPAVAVDAQQAKQRTCSSARAARGEGAGSSVGGVPRLVVLVLAPRGAACWPKVPGGVKERARVRVGASEHGWMRGAMCMPRGGGRLSKTVAMSLAREDHTTTPRWRARAKNCVLRRGRPVSRIGKKNEKSATCKPSTLRRSAWSRPHRRQRSASTSSPRRARTARRKWAG